MVVGGLETTFIGLVIEENGQVLLIDTLKRQHTCTSNCYDCHKRFIISDVEVVIGEDIKKFSSIKDAEHFIRYA